MLPGLVKILIGLDILFGVEIVFFILFFLFWNLGAIELTPYTRWTLQMRRASDPSILD